MTHNWVFQWPTYLPLQMYTKKKRKLIIVDSKQILSSEKNKQRIWYRWIIFQTIVTKYVTELRTKKHYKVDLKTHFKVNHFINYPVIFIGKIVKRVYRHLWLRGKTSYLRLWDNLRRKYQHCIYLLHYMLVFSSQKITIYFSHRTSFSGYQQQQWYIQSQNCF